MDFALAILLLLLIGAWVVYLKRRHPIEAAGYAVICLVAVAMLAVRPSRSIANILVGFTAIVWVPLVWVEFRRRWRDMVAKMDGR